MANPREEKRDGEGKKTRRTGRWRQPTLLLCGGVWNWRAFENLSTFETRRFWVPILIANCCLFLKIGIDNPHSNVTWGDTQYISTSDIKNKLFQSPLDTEEPFLRYTKLKSALPIHSQVSSIYFCMLLVGRGNEPKRCFIPMIQREKGSIYDIVDT